MKKIISLSFWVLIFSCSQKHEKNQKKRLPFYHKADFTPQWISDKTQLDTLHSLANFELTNQNNQKITQENLRGKIHVACFFFTLCPSLCPKIMGNMKVVQNRKDWRHITVMRLIENLKIDADAAVAEAKKIEKYVFQNDFIVEIDSEDQKQALENLIKSLKRD